MQVNRITRRDALILLLILFVAAMMRLGAPGVVEFKHDEAWLSRLAQTWLSGGPLPLTGMPSSVGVPNAPMSVYLIALPYALAHDPLAATLFVAALNVAGVGLLWLLAHRYVGRTVGLIAGLAYALNPWAVLYSRKIWAQDLHTPLFLAALLLGLYGFAEGKRWAQVLCLPLLVAALQIHFAAWALLPLFALLLWIGRQRISWASVGLSVVLAALALVPFLLGLSQTLRQDPNRLSSALNRNGGIALSADPVRDMAQLATGLGLETQIEPDDPAAFIAAVPPQNQLWALLGVLALLGLALVWTLKYRVIAPLLTIWAVFPLIVFTPGWTDVFPHYFVASLPVFSLLTGVSVAWLAANLPGKPISRTVVLAGFAVIVLTQGMWWRGLLRYVDTVDAGGFGVPLHRRLALRDALPANADVVLITPDSRLDYSEEPAVWDVLLHNRSRCFRAVSNEAVLVYPSQPFDAIITPDMDRPLMEGLHLSSVMSTYPRDVDTVYKVIHWNVEPVRLPAVTPVDPVQFSSGAVLTGYALDDGVRLNWVVSGPQNTDYHFFVHLLDANGERIAQQDAPFLEGEYWCAGDQVITTTAIDLPDNAETLRVGMYTLQGDRFVNADALDNARNAAAPWYDIKIED